MIFQILDRKDVGNGKSWYLCKGKLYNFIDALRKDFYEFQIQRRIVRNGYLDELYQTIQENSPIPPITLTASLASVSINRDELNVDFSLGNVDILDGLQRTFRLWIYYDLRKKIKANNIQTYKDFVDYLKKEDKDGEYILNLDFINSDFLKSVLDDNIADERLRAYREYDMYFAIWTNLTDAEIIKKMLVLNAGQRPVSSTHQYELLFLHYFDHDQIQIPEGVKLVREKDKDFYKVRRGERQIGQYTMSSIIVALQSYIEGSPLRIAPANYIVMDPNTVELKRIDAYFQPMFLSDFITHVYKIDNLLCGKNESFKKWFGKDTTLSGVFAAIGQTGVEIEDFIQWIIDDKINFRLDEFEKAYDTLASTRVNVGNVLRRAVYRYTCAEIAGEEGNWSVAFGIAKEENDTW